MSIITAKWLIDCHACPEQIEKFATLWPNGVELTPEVAEEAYREGLNTIWGACHMMTNEQRRAFIIWTLRQRQPYLVMLLKRAGMSPSADVDGTGLKLVTLVLENTWKATQTAREAVQAAWEAVWEAARMATRDVGDAAQATWNVIWDAAWAIRAEEEATRPAEEDAQAAWEVTWMVAREARDVTWDAAQAATWEVAWEAARREQHDYCVALLLKGETDHA